MTKLIALLLSLLTALSGFAAALKEDGADAAAALLWGVPVTRESVKDDFLAKLNDSDVAHLNRDHGYYKNLLVIFLKEEAALGQKYRLLRDNRLTLLGWYGPADLYVVGCGESSLTGLLGLSDTLMQNPVVAYAGPVSVSKAEDAYTPDDPFEGDEIWSESAPAGANWWLEAVDAREAWNYTLGSKNITVGILDSGINISHEELAGKVSFPAAKYARQNRAGSHGTHVAGLIAANHGNGVGLAGISPEVSLMTVDWEPSDLQFWSGNLKILFGFCDLVKAGAKVINCSFGSSSNASDSKGSDFGMLLDAALYSAVFSSLLNKGYDFVVVQSAGNGNSSQNAVDAFYNGTFCPITAGNAITFGKTKAEDILNRIIVVGAAANMGSGEYMQPIYSNVGEQVSVAAPGVFLYSCDMNDGEYCYKSGTSMSAPVVSGVAALVWSAVPSLKGDAVKRIVCDEANTDAVALQRTDYAYEGLHYKDYPMVNAALSVKAALWQTGEYGLAEGTADTAADTVTLQNGDELCCAVVGEDGSFSALLTPGTWHAAASDIYGNPLGSAEITVTAGQQTQVAFGGMIYVD